MPLPEEAGHCPYRARFPRVRGNVCSTNVRSHRSVGCGVDSGAGNQSSEVTEQGVQTTSETELGGDVTAGIPPRISAASASSANDGGPKGKEIPRQKKRKAAPGRPCVIIIILKALHPDPGPDATPMLIVFLAQDSLSRCHFLARNTKRSEKQLEYTSR